MLNYAALQSALDCYILVKFGFVSVPRASNKVGE